MNMCQGCENTEGRPLTEEKLELIGCQVKAGMAWLDEHYPDHVERFDADRFDIMNMMEETTWEPRKCVLIQATNAVHWMAAREEADLEHEECVGLGFLPGFGASYSVYNRLWLEAYAERRAALIG